MLCVLGLLLWVALQGGPQLGVARWEVMGEGCWGRTSRVSRRGLMVEVVELGGKAEAADAMGLCVRGRGAEEGRAVVVPRVGGIRGEGGCVAR